MMREHDHLVSRRNWSTACVVNADTPRPDRRPDDDLSPYLGHSVLILDRGATPVKLTALGRLAAAVLEQALVDVRSVRGWEKEVRHDAYAWIFRDDDDAVLTFSCETACTLCGISIRAVRDVASAALPRVK
jgi:hypothetical protein